MLERGGGGGGWVLSEEGIITNANPSTSTLLSLNGRKLRNRFEDCGSALWAR